jgi:hypothetical protein
MDMRQSAGPPQPDGRSSPLNEGARRSRSSEGSAEPKRYIGKRSKRSFKDGSADRQVLPFARRKADREHWLLRRVITGVEELGADLSKLAAMRGSLDGSAMFGPVALGFSNLEVIVRLRRQP